MKLLSFSGKDIDLFELAYIGLIGASGEVRLVPAEMRAHGKLLDKFEAHGTKHEQRGWLLADGESAKIPVEDTEMKVLEKCCQAFQWNLAKSRRISALYDLFEKAPDFKPEPPKDDAAPAQTGAPAAAPTASA